MMDRKGRLAYRPEIDGLRAIAVLPVLFFHSGLGSTGGFVGVDVFFVISGYLIGSLVLSEIESGTFRMVTFWERRIRRLFPALAVVILGCLVAGAVLLVPQHFAELGQSVIAQPLLCSNFYFWKQSGYFETASEFQPLLHTWSLAVEEQFYLFFPPIFMLLLRGGRLVASAGIICFLIASFVWSIYGTAHYPSLAFFLIPSRIWELDIGVLLALWPKGRSPLPLRDEIFSWGGLLLILGSVFFYDVNTPFPGAAALAPCWGTAMVIYGNSAGLTSSGIILSRRPFVFIGKISYSLYLIHWPVIVFLKYAWIKALPPFYLSGSLVVSFLLACLSWKYVETPFRKKKFLPVRWHLFFMSGILAALFVGIGSLLYLSKGLPARFTPEISQFEKEPNQMPGVQGLNQFLQTGELSMIGKKVEPESPMQLVLWGDSHAMSLMPVLDVLGKEHGIGIYTATEPGTVPIAGTHRADAGRNGLDAGTPVLEFVLNHKQIKNVLMTARWSIYVFGEPNEDLDLIVCDSQTESRSPQQAREVFVRNLRRTVARLRDGGVAVWIMRDVALQPRSVPETLAQTASRGMDLNSFAQDASVQKLEGKEINQLIDQAIQGLGAQVLDPIPLFVGPSGIYLMAKDGKALYNDRHHLTRFGSMQLRPLFEPVFDGIQTESAKLQ